MYLLYNKLILATKLETQLFFMELKDGSPASWNQDKLCTDRVSFTSQFIYVFETGVMVVVDLAKKELVTFDPTGSAKFNCSALLARVKKHVDSSLEISCQLIDLDTFKTLPGICPTFP